MKKNIYMWSLITALGWQISSQGASVNFPNCTVANAQAGNLTNCWNDVAGAYNNIVNIGNKHLWSNSAVTAYAANFVNQILAVSQAMCGSPISATQHNACMSIIPGFVALIAGGSGNTSGTSVAAEQWVSGAFTTSAVNSLQQLTSCGPRGANSTY